MHDVTIATFALCVLAALTAGFIDAVAGGGGLIQLPALLFALPHAALATVLGTNKSVSVVGTSAAANTYRKRMPISAKFVGGMAAAAFSGSLLGSLLATHVNRSLFEPVILVILIAVAIFTVLRPDYGSQEQDSRMPHPAKAPLIGAVIGFYDGLIGPGTGMFLLFSLVSIVGFSFLTASATAKFVNVATNVASLVIFVPTHHVLWILTLCMAPANFIGGIVGAHTALNRGSTFVRIIFLAMVVLLVVKLGVSLRH